MTRAWIRREPDAREGLGLVALAAGIGGLVACGVWYFGRILVARDEIELRPPADPERTLPRPREPGAER